MDLITAEPSHVVQPGTVRVRTFFISIDGSKANFNECPFCHALTLADAYELHVSEAHAINLNTHDHDALGRVLRP